MTEPSDPTPPPPELPHAMIGGHRSQGGRGGCVIHVEVDPKTGAALIAARDKMMREVFGHIEGSENMAPADPFALATVVLDNWAREVWRNGIVAPEHHEEAMRIAQARWREVEDQRDTGATPESSGRRRAA